MVDYVIKYDSAWRDNSENSRFVTSHFTPRQFIDIGEFSHFGNTDNENIQDLYSDSSLYNGLDDGLDFADNILYNRSQDINDNDSYEWDEEEANYLESPSVTTTVIKKDNMQKTSNRQTKGKGYSDFQKYYDKVEQYNPDAKRYRNLLSAIARVESGYRPWVVNSIGASGYFQFLNSTRRSTMRAINGPLGLNAFLNNPELQINAAIHLAKSFEKSFSSQDKEIAARKGHSMDGLISGAWLGGVGGVRRYLYKGKNASDGGTTIGARIRLGDQVYANNSHTDTTSTKETITNKQKVLQLMQYLPNFNIKPSSSQYWTPKSPTVSGHNCGKAVHLYIEALGLPTNGRPTYGGDYGPWLQKTGWNKISPQSQFQIGDICVTKGQGSNKEGHISMYNGRNWVSDFIQSSPLVYPWAKEGTNTFFYRYKG